MRRSSDVKVIDAYIKRNDAIFADAPQVCLPAGLNGYSSGSYASVVDGLGLEKVTDLFVTGVGL